MRGGARSVAAPVLTPVFTLVLALLAVAGRIEAQDDEGSFPLAGLLAGFRAGEEGGPALSPERLAFLYEQLVAFRAERLPGWPGDLDFHVITEAIHARAAANGHDLAPYAEDDWDLSIWFEQDQRYDEIRGLLRRNVRRYSASIPHRPLLLYCLAHYERLCRRWDAAARLLDEAGRAREQLAATSPTGDEALRAHVLIELERATVGIELGLLEESIPAVELALELADELGDPEVWGDAVVEELNLDLAFNDHEGMERVVRRAALDPRWAALSSDQLARIELRRGLGRGEYERAHPEAAWHAQGIVERVLADGHLIGFEERMAHVWLADLLLDRGALDEAEVHLQRAARSLGGRRWCGDDLPDRLEVGRVVLEGRLALARSSAPATLRASLERTEVAFDSLLSRWSETDVRDQGLAILHTRLRLQVTESVVALTLAVHGDEGPARALEHVARAQLLGTLARELGAGPAPEAEVRAELVPAGGCLLLFLPGATRSFAFVVDAEQTRAVDLPGVFRIDPARRALSRAIGRAVQSGADSEARRRVEELALELGRTLLPDPLCAHLAAFDEVVIVGIDSLGHVPFELLPLGATGRLGDAKAVSYLPSLPIGLWLARHRPAPREPVGTGDAGGGVIVVAAPDAPARAVEGSPPLVSLPFGAAERELLLGDCALPSRVLSGDQATLERLRALDAGDALVLHLLAHGIRVDLAHRPPGLLLAGEDGGAATLTPEAAEELAVPPLVFVTACGAWQGALRRGDDGRAHLVGSLLLAGARTIVVSHAPIDYRAGLETMGEVYGELTGERRSPAAALMHARRNARDDLTPYLLHAVGLASDPLPAAPVRDRPDRTWLVVLLGLGGLAALALLRRRRQ